MNEEIKEIMSEYQFGFISAYEAIMKIENLHCRDGIRMHNELQDIDWDEYYKIQSEYHEKMSNFLLSNKRIAAIFYYNEMFNK